MVAAQREDQSRGEAEWQGLKAQQRREHDEGWQPARYLVRIKKQREPVDDAGHGRNVQVVFQAGEHDADEIEAHGHHDDGGGLDDDGKVVLCQPEMAKVAAHDVHCDQQADDVEQKRKINKQPAICAGDEQERVQNGGRWRGVVPGLDAVVAVTDLVAEREVDVRIVQRVGEGAVVELEDGVEEGGNE